MENNNSNRKKGKSKGLIITIVVLILVILGLMFYIVYDKGIISFNNTDNKVELAGNKTKPKSIDKDKNDDKDSAQSYKIEPGFDSSKCINNKNVNYTLAVYANGVHGINLILDRSRKNLTFSYNNYAINKVYSLGWVTSSEEITMENQTITFDQEIADMFIGGFGQDASKDTVLLLMKDGSIEYIPIRKAFINDRMNIKSYGKLAGVSDIIKFYSVNVNGGVSTIAQKADGSFYDLDSILTATGNY